MFTLRLLVMVLFIICLMHGHEEVKSSATGTINGGKGSAVRTKKMDIKILDRKKKKKPSKKKKPPKKKKPSISVTTKAPAKITSTSKTKTPTTTTVQTSTATTLTTSTTTTARSTSISTNTPLVISTTSTKTTTAANNAGSGGECKTTGGSPCIFPFKDEKNKVYNVCKNKGGRYFWCATKVNEAGKFVYWSYCPENDPSCPLEVQTTTPSGGCKATNNKPCIFPFKDGNKEYNECADYKGSYYWCATGTNSAGKHTSWEKCPKDGTCPLEGQISISSSTESTITSTLSYNETATNAMVDVENMFFEIKETLLSMETVEFTDDEKELHQTMKDLTEYFDPDSRKREHTHYDPMQIYNFKKDMTTTISKIKEQNKITPGYSYAFKMEESSFLESVESAKLTEAINTPEWMAFEGGKIPVPPEDFDLEVEATYPGDSNSDLIKFLDGGCHGIHSIVLHGIEFLKSIKSKISLDLYGKISSEADRVLSEKDDWICGISEMLLLIKDTSVRKEFMKYLPLDLENIDEDLPENRIIPGNGTPSNLLEDRIIHGDGKSDGKEAEPGDIPWQGLLLRQWPFDQDGMVVDVENVPWDAFCGVTLIHSCYVLTARHCTFEIENTDQVRIILGDVKVPDLDQYKPGKYKGPGQEREVLYIHHYPNADGTPIERQIDITLILLKSSSSVSEKSGMIIKPIKLADPSFVKTLNKFPPFNDATVSGFGQTNSISPYGSNQGKIKSRTLLMAKSKIPRLQRCKDFYEMMDFGYEIQDHNVCVGGEYPYTGPCHGDSGGPITVTDQKTKESLLVGIISLGARGCPSWMVYGVGTDITDNTINGWINQILPTAEPKGDMGNKASDGEPCACLRTARKQDYYYTELQAHDFERKIPGTSKDLNRRHCFISTISPQSGNCGQTSEIPSFPLTIPDDGPTNGFTDWDLTSKFSDIICWEKFPKIPQFKEICNPNHQIGVNGKMHLKPFDPVDCPTELHLVPEYTHAYVLTATNTKQSQVLKSYNYLYVKQKFNKENDMTMDADCFSSLSMVTLSTGKKLSVSQVTIGHILQTVDQNGKLTNSPFIGWLHKDQHVKSIFINFITENQSFISLSPLHLILVSKDLHKKPTMKFANSVSIGDYLVSPHSKKMLRVISVTQSVETGVYAPLTETGTILVDGLIASCYAHIASHNIAHFAMLPVRLMPRLLEDKESERQDGIRTYAKYLMQIAEPLLISKKEGFIISKISLSTIATLISG